MAVLATVGLATAALAWAAPYREGPPVAHTGGFGEPTCHACHFGSAVNADPGRVRVDGPVSYEPGESYDLTVSLAHPEMEAAGFQLSARFVGGPHAGEQAGVLAPQSGSVAVAVDTATGLAYAHQTPAGAAPSAAGRARWTVRWTAPTIGSARAPAAGAPGVGADGGEDAPVVVFHVAANAANDDASEFGDRVYTDSLRARAVPVR